MRRDENATWWWTRGRSGFSRTYLWLDAGYRGEEKGKGWVEKVLGGGVWTFSLNVSAKLLQKRF